MTQLTLFPEVQIKPKIFRETCLNCGKPIPKEKQKPGRKYCCYRCGNIFGRRHAGYKPYPPGRKTCLGCSKPIPQEEQRPGKKYCCDRCSVTHRRRKQGVQLPPPSRTTCLNCEKPIPKERQLPGTRFCSRICSSTYYQRKCITIEGSNILSPGTLGAIGESVACIDLTRKGYLVFKAYDPNSPYDLVIFKDSKFETVEVKVGKRNPAGTLIYPKAKIRAGLLAVILRDEIVYIDKTMQHTSMRD